METGRTVNLVEPCVREMGCASLRRCLSGTRGKLTVAGVDDRVTRPRPSAPMPSQICAPFDT